MTVYVDELRSWPHARYPFHNGSCHLTADTTAELMAFAVSIGLRRSWFQHHPTANHFDLTPVFRMKALAAGAVFKTAREQAIVRRGFASLVASADSTERAWAEVT